MAVTIVDERVGNCLVSDVKVGQFVYTAGDTLLISLPIGFYGVLSGARHYFASNEYVFPVDVVITTK